MSRFPSFLVCCVLPFASAQAATLWSVDAALGSQSLTGTFEYDAVTNMFSAANLSLSGDVSEATAGAYSFVLNVGTACHPDTCASPSQYLTYFASQPDLNGARLISMSFDPGLATNAIQTLGRGIAPDYSFGVSTIRCFSADCAAPVSLSFDALVGTATPVSGVPEPASVFLSGSALLGLFAIVGLRRRSARRLTKGIEPEG